MHKLTQIQDMSDLNNCFLVENEYDISELHSCRIVPLTHTVNISVGVGIKIGQWLQENDIKIAAIQSVQRGNNLKLSIWFYNENDVVAFKLQWI